MVKNTFIEKTYVVKSYTLELSQRGKFQYVHTTYVTGNKEEIYISKYHVQLLNLF